MALPSYPADALPSTAVELLSLLEACWEDADIDGTPDLAWTTITGVRNHAGLRAIIDRPRWSREVMVRKTYYGIEARLAERI
jgi:hypothetical protein